VIFLLGPLNGVLRHAPHESGLTWAVCGPLQGSWRLASARIHARLFPSEWKKSLLVASLAIPVDCRPMRIVKRVHENGFPEPAKFVSSPAYADWHVTQSRDLKKQNFRQLRVVADLWNLPKQGANRSGSWRIRILFSRRRFFFSHRFRTVAPPEWDVTLSSRGEICWTPGAFGDCQLWVLCCEYVFGGECCINR